MIEQMSIPRNPDPAKLVIGVFLQETGLLATIAPELEKRFGRVDLISPWLPFDYTDYYQPEFGGPLFRRMFAFHHLINQGDLPEIKIATNAIESDFSRQQKRRVNIDPGYMLRERFVLATGKNYSHRIYLGKGIYADLTLMYQKKKFCSLPWTYPDYSSPEMLLFLNQVRKRYLFDLKT